MPEVFSLVSDESPSRPETPGPASPSPSGHRFVPPTVEAMNAALPQYEFVKLIGVGGMGAVYKARQPKLNRFVAIKILPPIPDDELGFAERFEREAQSMAQLSHPHIVSVYDFGETADGQLYFVMEYIEGADLHQLIGGGQLTLDHFYGWIPQVCDAIQYAHDRGIIHRDIKPANILIDVEGRVKIADFGLAKLTGDHPETALTKADLSMGTPDYAAPEQLDGGHEVDWRSDIYSLGVVMYQMLTGRLPRGAFPMPSESDAELDPRLDQVVLRAMQSEPESRFQRASDISDRLTEIRAVPSTAPTPRAARPRPSSSGKRGVIAIVSSLVGASVIAGLALAYINRDHRQERRAMVTAAVERTRETPKPESVEEPAPPAGDSPPPRDFARKAPTAENPERPGNFSAFRDKLGRKASELSRRNAANLTVVNRAGDSLDQAGPLADLPRNLLPIARLAIGQSPPMIDNERRFAIAVQVNGKLVAWGDNSRGQLDAPADASLAVEVAAGAYHALALLPDGTVRAWGDDSAGQCAIPKDLGHVAAIAAGRDFSLALTTDGGIRAWGGSGVDRVPADLTDVMAITAGYGHAAALRRDGTVVNWGTNDFGQLDQPPGVTGATAITASFGSTHALLGDGRVISWGSAGPDATRADADIIQIRGTADSLVARARDDRLIVLGANGRPGALPGFLRGLPPEVSIEFAGSLVFLWREAPLRLDRVAEDNEPAPVVPEPSVTEAGIAIADLRQKFEIAYHEQVTGPWEASITQLNQYYLSHLEERQAEAAAGKNLEEALAWRDESDRVRSGEPLPESDDPGLVEGLRALRVTYRQKSGEYETARRDAEAELLEKYQRALADLQDRYTAEQKLDDALEVRAFRERLIAE